MSEDQGPDRAVRSFNFDKVSVVRTDRGIEARTHKRMDRFTTGMEDVGRPRRVLNPISERQARLLYEALGEVLGEDPDGIRDDPLVEKLKETRRAIGDGDRAEAIRGVNDVIGTLGGDL